MSTAIEDQLNEIYVEVKSNAMSHDGNKPHYFRNKMNPPIHLGEGNWDVALSSIMYEHNWLELKGEYNICLMLPREDKSGAFPTKLVKSDPKLVKSDPKLDRFEIAIGPSSVDGAKYNFAIDQPAGKLTDFTFDWVKIRVLTDDRDITKVCDNMTISNPLEIEIQTKRSRAEIQKTDARVVFFYNKMKRRVEIDSTCYNNQLHIFFPSDSLPLLRLLGFDKSKAQMVSDYYAYKIPDKYEAPLPPNKQRISSLMLYSNVVNEQRVGDSYVQFLGSVPVNSKQGDVVHFQPMRLEYRPVKYGLRYIDEILVQLNDFTGKEIEFDGGVTSATLAFRKRKLL